MLSCVREVADTSVPAQTPVEPEAGQVIPGQVLVQIARDIHIEDIDFSALGTYTLTRTFPPAGKFEARHRAAGLDRWYTLSFSEDRPLTKAAADIGSLPGVTCVEPVPQVKLTAEIPFNDPRFSSLWGLYNPGGKAQWAEGCDVNALNAWTIETGKPEVIVAVIDSGVDYMHEDLRDHIWVNEAELNGQPAIDDDDNGYVDDIYGYNFVTYDRTNPAGKLDPGNHGTHVAGTIGAVSNNGIGIAGVAGGNGSANSGVRIMPVQMIDEKGHDSFAAAAIVYAADNGAVLANCSWGNVNYESPTSSAMVQAIDYFNACAGMDPQTGEQTGPMAGGLMLFAAGNDGREIEHPAMDDNVFAVAALSANYVRSYFTSYGDWVDISAPGGDANRGVFILSCLPDNNYGNMQGSSMAAPHATGVAALVTSYAGAGKKGFTREKLINILTSTANTHALDENGSYASKLGAGLIDAYAALLAVSEEQMPLPVSSLSAEAHSNSIVLQWEVPGSAEVSAPYSFNIFYAASSLEGLDPQNPGENVRSVSVLSYGKQAGEKMESVFSDLFFDKQYHFRIQSEGISGLKSALSPETVATTGHNTLPVITPLDGTSITLKASETGTLRFKASDGDGHPLTFVPGESLPGLSASFQDNLVTLTVNAQKAAAGTYSGVFSVSDGYAMVEQTFSYTVLANQVPVVVKTIGSQVFNGTSEIRTFPLSEYFSDADGENLSYKVSSSSVSLIVQSSIKNGVLSLQGRSLGTTDFTVEAIDASGASCSQTFAILVRSGDVPVEAYPNPVKDNLYIRPAQPGAVSVKLVSSLGNTVFDGQLQADPFSPATIDCKGFPAGVYTLFVEMGSEKFKTTLVKQ